MDTEIRNTLPDIPTMTRHVEDMVYYDDSNSEHGFRLKNKKYGGYFDDHCDMHKLKGGHKPDLKQIAKEHGVKGSVTNLAEEIERKVWNRNVPLYSFSRFIAQKPLRLSRSFP